MKKSTLYFFSTLFFVVGLFSIANAQSSTEEKSSNIPPSDVAPKAMKAFTEKFKNAQKVAWEFEIKRGTKVYEAEFMMDSKEYSAKFDENGNWDETEFEIKFSDLPTPIQQAFSKSKFKDAKILEVESVSRATVLQAYELEVQLGNQEYELLFNPDGQFREEKKD